MTRSTPENRYALALYPRARRHAVLRVTDPRSAEDGVARPVFASIINKMRPGKLQYGIIIALFFRTPWINPCFNTSRINRKNPGNQAPIPASNFSSCIKMKKPAA